MTLKLTCFPVFKYYSIMYVTSCYRVASHQDELTWMSPGAIASDAILPDTAEEPCLTYVDNLSLIALTSTIMSYVFHTFKR